jgi:threonine dehydratase
VEQGRLVRLVITVIDRPGGLHAITQVLAETRANILQIYHQRNTLQPVGEAEVEADLETRGREHTDEVIQALTERGFQVRRV